MASHLSNRLFAILVALFALTSCAHKETATVPDGFTAEEWAAREAGFAKEDADHAKQQRDARPAFVDELTARLSSRAKSIKAAADLSSVSFNQGLDDGFTIESDLIKIRTDPIAENPGGVGNPMVGFCAETQELVYQHKGGGLVVGNGTKVRHVSVKDIGGFLALYGCESWGSVTDRLRRFEEGYDHDGYVALAGAMEFLDDSDVHLHTGPIVVALDAERKSSAESKRFQAVVAAGVVMDEQIAAAFAKPAFATLLPLARDSSKQFTEHLKHAADADAAKAEAFKTALTTHIEQALTKGRAATAAALAGILLRMNDGATPTQSVAELLASKPTTVEQRARVAAATLARELLPAARAEGDEANAVLHRLYTAGEMTSAWPMGALLKVTPGGADAITANGKNAKLTLKVAKPTSGSVHAIEERVTRDSGTTTDEMSGNPAYAKWLDKLAAYDTSIAQMGGDVDRSFANSRRASYVDVSTAVEGSYVKTERVETDASLSQRSTAALSGLASRMGLHALENERAQHLEKEPEQRIMVSTRHAQVTEYRVQEWESSLARSFVVSGLGANVAIDQEMHGKLTGKRFITVYVDGATKHDVAKKPEDMTKEVVAGLDAAACARVRDAVAKDLATRLAARDQALVKSIPSDTERAEESAYARALFGAPAG